MRSGPSGYGRSVSGSAGLPSWHRYLMLSTSVRRAALSLKAIIVHAAASQARWEGSRSRKR